MIGARDVVCVGCSFVEFGCWLTGLCTRAAGASCSWWLAASSLLGRGRYMVMVLCSVAIHTQYRSGIGLVLVLVLGLHISYLPTLWPTSSTLLTTHLRPHSMITP